MYTEEEIMEMQKSKSYWDRIDPNYKQINDEVSAWYKERYGTKEKENESDPKETTENDEIKKVESSEPHTKTESTISQNSDILPKTHNQNSQNIDPISEL